MKIRYILWIILAGMLGVATLARAQGTTAFSYHGQLSDSGQPAHGTYDVTFTLYDAWVNGGVIGRTWTNTATAVTNGLFNVMVDFGGGVFSGPARWLELGVRTNGGGSFAPLAPRQALAPIPYALTASNLSGTLPAAQLTGALPATQLSGTLSPAQLPSATVTNGQATVALGGTFSGNGYYLTNTPVVPPPGAIAANAPVPTPAYNAYYDFANGVTTNQTDAWMRSRMALLATNGMQAAGYKLLIIDDSWPLPSRDSNNNLVPNPALFPSGISGLASYAHGQGFALGVYTDLGVLTCLGYPGSPPAVVAQDMMQFASWGVDAVKMDACSPGGQTYDPPYQAAQPEMLRCAANALIRTERPMLLNATVTSWPPPREVVYELNVWPATGTYDFVAQEVSNIVWAASYVTAQSWQIGPGHFPNWGNLGYGGLPTNATVAFLTMSAMTMNPFAYGTPDPANVPWMTNPEMLAVYRDPACLPPAIVYSNALVEVWSRPLGGVGSGSNALALVNLNSTAAPVPVNFSSFAGYSGQSVTIRDCWNHATRGAFTGGWTNTIPANSALLYVATMAPTYSASSIVGGVTGTYVLSDNGTNRTFWFTNGILMKVQ